MLDAYFAAAETVWSRCRAIIAKLAADGIMVVFSTMYDAVCAAQDMRQEVGKLLQTYGLQAGIGVHTGPLVEGLRVAEMRELTVKGKEKPLQVAVLQGLVRREHGQA